jgi:hypothetical protein
MKKAHLGINPASKPGGTACVECLASPKSWWFHLRRCAEKKAGLSCVHMPGLGGFRHAKCDSVNTGGRNASFRGFADHLRTSAFKLKIEELIQLAKQERVALMCAEAVPWRCRRSLIADALLVRRIRTGDIMSPIRRTVQTLTPFAKARGTTITHPAGVSPGKLKKSPSPRSAPRPSEDLIHTMT